MIEETLNQTKEVQYVVKFGIFSYTVSLCAY